MKIVAVACWKEDLDLKRPYTIAYHTVSAVENIFVLLKPDDGRYGIGAGAPAPYVTGERTNESLTQLCEHAEKMLVGKDIRHYKSILKQAYQHMRHFPAARAAIDIALHDLWGQFIEMPITEWFGLAHHRLPTSITIGIKDTVTETLEEAQEFIDLGFRIIKLKTGHSVEQDIETFRCLRELVGSEVDIRVDANQGYSPDDLQQFAQATSEHRVEFFEQPFPPDRVDWMQSIPSALAQQCAADENVHDASQAIQLAAAPLPFGIYNIKLMKCGGISEALRIARVAERSGIDLMWGCMDESIVSISAALHTALASPATAYLDLDGSFDLARDLVTGGFVLEDGYLSTTQRPGLGVELNFDPESRFNR